MSDSNRRFNLNLLPLLDALLECRSVTRAGERFNLTQPAASAALSKLREAFGDELLVHVGREMKLTPKAERIREPVKQLLGLLEAAFESSDDLDPAAWSGEFIIATADYLPILVLPSLIQKIESVSPKLTVRFTNITRGSVSNLRSDEIDMIIAPPQVIDDEALMSRKLFSDRFVVIHSKDSPPPRTLEDYMRRGHITTVIDAPQIGGLPRSFFSSEIDSLRTTQRNHAVLPYYSVLPLLVARNSCAALVQERLAKLYMELLPIAYCDPPVAIPTLDLHMFWSPKFNEDPRHAWLRNAIFDVCAVYR